MVITNRNESINIPITVPIDSADTLSLSRYGETETINYTKTSDFFVSALIPATFKTGEWNYKIGNNVGLIQIVEDVVEPETYNNDKNTVEYEFTN